MKDWLSEIIDQIALGEILAESNVSCGQRFGLIAVDNAVEFMLIAYVETYKQLIGGHKVGGITKKDWDETKRHFPKLLTFVVTQEANLASLETEISRYHDFRNSLYHSGTPVTTSPSRVKKYSDLARKVLPILFSITLTADEWDNILAQNASVLSGNTVTSSIKRQVTYELIDGLVKFSTTPPITASEAVALCLHGYSVVTSSPPSRPSLIQALARSGHPLSAEVAKARLYDLKKNGWLQKTELILSSKGRKKLGKKFLIDGQ